MNNNHLLPYKMFKEYNDWTVETLKLMLYINDENRIPIETLFKINNKTVNNYQLNKEEVKYIRVSDIDNEYNSIDKVKIGSKSIEDLPRRGTLVANKDDIIISRIRPGSSGIALINDNEEYVASNALIVLTPKDRENAKLLYFIMSSKKVLDELSALGRGTTNDLPIKQLTRYKIPVQSLPGPEKDKANKLYQKLYKALNEEEPLIEIINEVFKNKLLDSDLDNNNENNDYLIGDYESLLNSPSLTVDKFLYEKNKPKWSCNVDNLKDFIEFKRVKDKPGKNQYYDKKIPRITINDLLEDEIYLDIENIDYIKCEEGIDNEYIKDEDIIVSKKVDNPTKINIANENIQGAIVNQYLYVIKANEMVLNNEYLTLFLKSKWGQKQFQIKSSGSVMSMINKSDIREIEIPLPDLNKQKEIVTKVKRTLDKNKLDFILDQIKDFQNKILYKGG